MLFGEGVEFNCGVEILRVFPEHHDVNFGIPFKGRSDAGERFSGAEVDIQIKELPHLQNRRLKALYSGLGGDRRHQGSVGVFDFLYRLRRHGVAAWVSLAVFFDGFFPHAPPQVRANPVDGEIHRLQNEEGSLHHIKAGIIPRHITNLVAILVFLDLHHVASHFKNPFQIFRIQRFPFRQRRRRCPILL